MPSFSIPLTGLEADSTALNVIANNLANLNTTAYKSQSTSFSDLFYQQIGSTGSGNAIQVGAGTQVAAIAGDFSQGSVNTTGNSTDVAIKGNGFFVVKNNGTMNYTRAGNFTLSSDGHLTTQDGDSVMGYSAVNGTVNTNSPLTAIQIPIGAVEQPNATTKMTLAANLDASAVAGTQVPAQITLYDSLGVSHLATVTFTKAATGSDWNYTVSLPAGESTGNANTTGTLSFDTNGNLTAPTGNVSGISFTGLTSGASPMNFTWDLYGASQKPLITQVTSASGVTSTVQDGFASGQYDDFTISSNGLVSAKFDNGQTSAIGQLALATVNNEQGLSRSGDNIYSATLASGEASIGVAGAAGRGILQDGGLEQSNVDISTQFSSLIIAQRAFEANSKAITTFDTVTQETINMIH